MQQRTDEEWAEIFRLMQKADALVSVNSSDNWYDAEIEEVEDDHVILKQTFDTGRLWEGHSEDVYETFRYTDLNTVAFWVAS